jgi:hypothetical protein
MVLKCSSLSFSAASFLIFYALIRWILLQWLGVRPGGHQRGAGAIPGVVVLNVRLCQVAKTRWSGLGNWTVWFDGHRDLVPTSILVCTFASETSSCSTATSSRLFSMSGFALPLAEDSLLGPVFS